MKKETNICEKCHRVKLRAEEEIIVMIQKDYDILKKLALNSIGIELEDSKREHRCRPKVGDKIRVWEMTWK